MVVADDSVAGGGASEDCVRAAVWGWRDVGGAAGGVAEERESAGLGEGRYFAAADEARSGGPDEGRSVPGYGARGGAAHSEGGGGDGGFSVARSGSSPGRAGGVCGSCAADVRFAGAGDAGGCD